jgi:hypothetical protein
MLRFEWVEAEPEWNIPEQRMAREDDLVVTVALCNYMLGQKRVQVYWQNFTAFLPNF